MSDWQMQVIGRLRALQDDRMHIIELHVTLSEKSLISSSEKGMFLEVIRRIDAEIRKLEADLVVDRLIAGNDGL